MNEKYEIQEAQYEFPYHYIPYFASASEPSTVRNLNWGLEYLCYQYHARDVVLAQKPGSVLEVGCGDGFFVGLLKGRVPVLKGVDLSERAIRFAKAFHDEIEFDAVDAATLTEQYDVVAALEVLEHIPDESVPGFLQTLAQRTRPGGVVVLSVPTKAQPLHKKHFRHYDAALLRDEIARSGVSLEVRSTEYIFHESAIFTFWRKLSSNKWWVFEIKPLRKLWWRYAWGKLRYSSEAKGRHMICVLEKR